MKQATRRKFLPGLMAPAALLGDTPKKLPDFTYTVKDTKEIKETFGLHRKYFEGPTDQLKLMVAGSLSLNPGATPHPPHQHPEEEILLVTEGTGIIGLKGKDKNVGPGSMMYCAANQSHDIRNTGKVPLTFFYYKWKA